MVAICCGDFGLVCPCCARFSRFGRQSQPVKTRGEGWWAVASVGISTGEVLLAVDTFSRDGVQ